jgi:hypothetical protein
VADAVIEARSSLATRLAPSIAQQQRLDALMARWRTMRDQGATLPADEGWSWGTQYSGMFIMAHPEKVAKYVSYA